MKEDLSCRGGADMAGADHDGRREKESENTHGWMTRVPCYL
jgi:hypothetical protein